MARRPTAQSVAALRPGALALAVDVARRFHLDGDSKVRIAQDLGINRFKVARLLELARLAGLVQVVVGAPADLDAGLSAALRERYGLQHALVLLDAGADGAVQRLRVGRLAAELLEQLLTEDDVVGLAWGRTVSAVVDSWSERVPATFVQLAGSLARDDVAQNGPELITSMARRAGGRAITFYAPLVVADENTAVALHGDGPVARAVQAMDDLTKAVVSIGAWAPGQSTVRDALSPTDRAELDRAGVRAEVTGLLFGADGRVVDALGPRSLCVTEQQLRSTPQVIALAAGAERAGAVQAVLRSGLLDGLVTHASLAREVLDGAGP
ncbi:sugar-binding transcriptional regulator [Kineococcus sp. SYSU DK003]|uniref:sugar-binding transcriptional regulator n=1 Tax=Kineococcus sp. SYSU DK003 TaxID=3383124 RepID=UPI003D7EBB5F